MAQNQTEQEERLLRLPEVMARLGIARSSVWRMVAEGKLPKPVKLAPRTTVWRNSEISAFIDSLRVAE